MRKTALLFALIALPLHADLGQRIKSVNGWVGYTVPVSGRHVVCSYDGDSININDMPDTEPASSLRVLYQVERGQVISLRMSSPECTWQRNAQWIDPVDPRESAQFLKTLIDGGDMSVAKKALTAFALHRDTADDLIRYARENKSSKIRSMALFWVSQEAGDKAAAVLKDAVENDPEEEVRAKAVFGISQLPNDKSIPLLVDLMKNNRSRAVRKKAAFWLGQKDDPRALAALEDVLLH